MKKIVLRNLPPELRRAVRLKALSEDSSRAEAVVAMIRELELQKAIDCDMEMIEAEMKDNEPF